MNSGAQRFTFIDASNPNTSQRSKEVSLAKVRAHAARVAHKRKQANADSSESVTRATPDHSDAEADQFVRLARSPGLSSHTDAVVAIDVPTSVKAYFASIMPQVATSCEGFNCRQIWSPDLLTYSVDENVFHSITAVMQSIDDAFTHRSPRPPTPTDTVLQHRALAIRGLRLSLSQTVAPNGFVLMAILLMAVLESRCGNFAQRDLHRAALGKLSSQHGGLEMVDEYMTSIILQFEFFWAIETGSTSIQAFLPDNLDFSRKLSFGDISDYLLHTLPLSFQSLAKQNTLSLGAVQEIINTHDRQKREANKFLSPNHGPVHLTNNDSTHRNYWEVCSDLLAIAEGESTSNALICLALLLYNSLVFTELSVWDARFLWTNRIRSVRRDLIKRLVQCRRRRSMPEELALFWVISVAVGACKSTIKGDCPDEGRLLATFAYNRFSRWIKFSEGPTIISLFLFHESICYSLAATGSKAVGLLGHSDHREPLAAISDHMRRTVDECESTPQNPIVG